MGHRAENISRAVSLIADRIGRVSAISHTVETPAWGYDSANPYINLGINVETDLSVEEIIGQLQGIEQTIAPGESHRNDDGSYADRTIDLDLICVGQTVSNTPAATLPHPRMAERDFVLQPMREILPQWTHPSLGLNAAKMMLQLHTIKAPCGAFQQ